MQPQQLSQQPSLLLEAVGLGKRYNRLAVLSGVDLAVHPGEVITLIGPNGSGKTTLLKILLGLLPPDEGRVVRAAGLRVGYVPQKIHFDPNLPLTVRWYLRLFSRDKAEMAAVVEELAIGHLLKNQLSGLSGGELQRVLLAQALLEHPQLLVLDEPVQGVDIGGQARLYQLIRNVSRQRGCAVLMVSHDLHLVMSGTDRVICLNRHICCSGTPRAVSADPEFTKLFGRDVAEQISLYVHHHDHRHGMGGEVICNGD